MKQYDYTALTASGVAEPAPSVTQDRKKWLWGGILLAAVVFGAIALTSSQSFGAGKAPSSHGIGFLVITNALMVLVPIAVITVGIYYAIQINKKRIARIKAFAAANGLVFTENVAPTNLRGLIFDNGSSRYVRQSLSFPDGIEIGNYEFTTGSGKNRRVHTFSYARVDLSRPLPNMVLDAKTGNFLGMTNLPDFLHSSQKLELEGDFNNYFDLYVPAAYERDALYIFTPDVMQALVEHASVYDIEIVENEMYLYRAVMIDLSSEKQLTDVLKVVDIVAAELKQQTHRYTDERASAASLAVAPAGQRLKKGINWPILGLVAFFAVSNVSLSLSDSEQIYPVLMLGGIVFWGVVIFAVVRTIRRRR